MTSRQVVQLLNTLDDVWPAPETWTGRLVKQSAKRGPAPSRWHDCLTCNGSGSVLDRFKRASKCGECSGRGRVHVDDYTNERVSSAESGLLLHVDTVMCDRCAGDGMWKQHRCVLCNGSGRRVFTRDEEQEKVRRAGDGYAIPEPWWSLCLRLDWLRPHAPLASRFVWTVHVTKTRVPGTLLSIEAWALREALEWLAYKMPAEIEGKPLEVPGWVRHAAAATTQQPKGRWANGHNLVKRDAEIRKLARQGRAQQWIAREFGLTPARICQVVKGAA